MKNLNLDDIKIDFEIKSFDDFIEYNKIVNNFLNETFSENLLNTEESFKHAFCENHISLYTSTDKNKREDLMQLISSKRKEYISLFKQNLFEGKFDKIFTDTEKENLINVIESNIISAFDELFINWEKNISDKAFDSKHYGGIIDGEIVGYREFIKNEDLYSVNIEDDISMIPVGDIFVPVVYDQNSFITYLNNCIDLINNGITEEKLWLDIEKYYLDTWFGEGNISILGTLESYFSDYLADPEVGVFFRKKLDDSQIKNIVDLSVRYFSESYLMEKVNLAQVEPIFSGGDSGFMKVLGRNFPNDIESKKKYGVVIYIVVSAIKSSFDTYRDSVSKVIGLIPDSEKADIQKYMLEEVVYHEFGHNLFKSNYDSNLEELKATLYFFLKLYDEKDLLNEKNIKSIIYTTLFDVVKNFARDGQKQYYKYVFLNRVLCFYMKDCGVILFENDKIVISDNIQSFGKFLDETKNILLKIKDIYESGNTDDENKFIEFIEKNTQSDVEKIKEMLLKNN